MQRRDFLKSGLAATGAVGLSSLGKAHADHHDSEHEYYELRHWHIPSAQKKAVVDRFLKNAVMPASKRINLGPMGVFIRLIILKTTKRNNTTFGHSHHSRMRRNFSPAMKKLSMTRLSKMRTST